MSYHGTIRNGVVVLDTGATLPEGLHVKIEPAEQPVNDSELDPVWRMGELAGPTGVPDLSVNADVYLHR